MLVASDQQLLSCPLLILAVVKKLLKDICAHFDLVLVQDFDDVSDFGDVFSLLKVVLWLLSQLFLLDVSFTVHIR